MKTILIRIYFLAFIATVFGAFGDRLKEAFENFGDRLPRNRTPPGKPVVATGTIPPPPTQVPTEPEQVSTSDPSIPTLESELMADEQPQVSQVPLQSEQDESTPPNDQNNEASHAVLDDNEGNQHSNVAPVSSNSVMSTASTSTGNSGAARQVITETNRQTDDNSNNSSDSGNNPDESSDTTEVDKEALSSTEASSEERNTESQNQSEPQGRMAETASQGQSTQSAPSEDSSNKSETTTDNKSNIVIITVSLLCAALAIGGIYFGLPRYKKWRAINESSNILSFPPLPNWEKIQEDRKKMEMEKYYETFS